MTTLTNQRISDNLNQISNDEAFKIISDLVAKHKNDAAPVLVKALHEVFEDVNIDSNKNSLKVIILCRHFVKSDLNS